MRKLISLILVSIVLISCADKKVINGVEYRPYGILNEDAYKCDSIQYSPSGAAICSGIIFCECIIPPVYVFGFNLWEPIRSKPKTKCQ